MKVIRQLADSNITLFNLAKTLPLASTNQHSFCWIVSVASFPSLPFWNFLRVSLSNYAILFCLYIYLLCHVSQLSLPETEGRDNIFNILLSTENLEVTDKITKYVEDMLEMASLLKPQRINFGQYREWVPVTVDVPINSR